MFYAIKRRHKYGHQLLGESFHFGKYSQDGDSKLFDEIEEGESVSISKNIHSMPGILGQSNMMVPTDLMLNMRKAVTAKWRKVNFDLVFNFAWDEDSVDPVETYIAEIEQAMEASDEYVELDPMPEETTYQRLAEKYRQVDWKISTNYWEMFLENSTRCANRNSRDDVVEFVWPDDSGPIVHNNPNMKDTNCCLFSFADLVQNKILQIEGRIFAMLPEQYQSFSPLLEDNFWECVAVK